MKINHFIGGILLVSGTTIGAGMLALPLVTATVGFFPSLVILGFCWILMLATAFFFLDVNISIEGEPNLISMAHRTLGTWGQSVSWIVYLLLLYSLTAAYISASAPLFQLAITKLTGFEIPLWAANFSLPVLFGCFVYFGTLGVDMINRVLMLGLGISYALLVGLLPEHIDGNLLLHVDWTPSVIAIPVVITAFGYHIIIPSLSTYMNHDRKYLRWTLIIGSIIPLIIYFLWQVMILGIIPIQGEVSLVQAYEQGVPIAQPLSMLVPSRWIKVFVHFFSFFAIVTSFLGVSLSLSDFLTDGFKIKKTWEGRFLAILLTFIPPLIFVFTYARGFVVALEYAGAFVAILLVFLPAIMAWQLKKPKLYRTLGGRIMLISVMLIALIIVVSDIMEQFGVFKPLVAKYAGL